MDVKKPARAERASGLAAAESESRQAAVSCKSGTPTKETVGARRLVRAGGDESDETI